MAAPHKDHHRVIRERFNTEWQAGAYSAVPVLWPNTFNEGGTHPPYIRMEIEDHDTKLGSIGSFGSNIHFIHGTVFTIIHVKPLTGVEELFNLHDVAIEIFRHYTDMVTGLKFIEPPSSGAIIYNDDTTQIVVRNKYRREIKT